MNSIDQSIYSMNRSFADFTKSRKTPYYTVQNNIPANGLKRNPDNKNHHHMSVGKKVAITGTSLILGSMLVTVALRGRYDKAFKTVENLLERMEENLLESTLKGNKIGKARTLLIEVAGIAKKGLHTLEGLANGSLVKDRLSEKAFFLNAVLKKTSLFLHFENRITTDINSTLQAL